MTRFSGLLSTRAARPPARRPHHLALGLLTGLLLAGCEAGGLSAPVPPAVEQAAASEADQAAARLAVVLAAQSEEHKARHAARNPQQTLEFFGLRPGMVVAEALPGGGWYTRVLADFVGPNGAIYGVNYPDEIWRAFGMPADRIAQRVAATDAFAGQVAEYSDTPTRGFTFATVPAELEGTADAVLLIRALHNLHRFRDAGLLDTALKGTYAMLKPGGVVGVVQHRAPASADDDWASGRAGYLKTERVKQLLTDAGFVFEAESEINANPKDRPTGQDVVWRLPPSYAGGPATQASVDAIGESDRMTLRFRKPG